MFRVGSVLVSLLFLHLFQFEYFFSGVCPALVREKANLAVTVFNDQNQILAHASFLDHPAAELVDEALWESYLHNHFRSDSCMVGIIQSLPFISHNNESTWLPVSEVYQAAGELPVQKDVWILDFTQNHM